MQLAQAASSSQTGFHKRKERKMSTQIFRSSHSALREALGFCLVALGALILGSGALL